MRNQYYYEPHEPDNPLGCVLLIIIMALWAIQPIEYSWPLYGWLFCGISVYSLRLWFVSKVKQLNWKEELWISFKVPCEGFWGEILLWPISFIKFVFTRDFESFSSRYVMRVGNEMYKEMVRNGASPETVYGKAKQMLKVEELRAERFREVIDTVPEQLEAKAQTAYACGAIVTAVAGAATPAKAETFSTNTLQASVYGWVTVVGSSTESTNYLALRHVRVRPTVILGDAIKLFGDLELRELDPKGQNWVKQAFVEGTVGKGWSFRSGRIALSPLFISPPPHKLETINSPRLPYRVTAYGIQAEHVSPKWKFMGDVSGRSGLSFDADRQFESIETTVRLEHAPTKKLRLGLQTQAGEDFLAGGIDWGYRPTEWLYLKGTGYGSENRGQQTIGGYAYLGISPCPALEIYGQFDSQVTGTVHSDVISSGVTLNLNKRKNSQEAVFSFENSIYFLTL